MKRIDWDSAYGVETDAFHHVVVHALQEEEKPVKRKSMSAVLIAAILIVVLAATALAVANRAGLVEFYEKWQGSFGSMDPENYSYKLEGEEALMTATFDDLVVTVTEGVGEGLEYFFATTIELAPGVKGILTDELVMDEDGTTHMEGAESTPIYYVETYLQHVDAASNAGDVIYNDDGSITFYAQQTIMEAVDTAQMYVLVRYIRVAPGEIPKETDSRQAYLPFTIPMPEAIEARHMAAPVRLDALGMTIDDVYLRRTDSLSSAWLFFQYDGGEAVDFRLPENLPMYLENDAGERLHGNRLYPEWIDGNRYRAFVLLEPGVALPQALHLRVMNQDETQLLGEATLPVDSSTLPQDMPEGYRHLRSFTWDQRDMRLPWTHVVDAEFQYLSAPDGATIPVYADPTDPTTLVGEYNSGVRVSVGADFRQWRKVYPPYGTRFGIEGYVASDVLMRNDSASTPGVPMAVVTADSVLARICPEDGATIMAVLKNSDTSAPRKTPSWYNKKKTARG